MKLVNTRQQTGVPATTDSPNGHLQSVRFGDVLAPLRTALGQDQGWLLDFCNDDVLLPRDLYEVIQAFAQLHSSTERHSLVDQPRI